ncbi:MAG: FliO/MopB family protein [Acidimicrobiales bacterium]
MTDVVLAAQHGIAMAPDVSVGHVLAQMVLWLGVIVVALFGLSKLARRRKGTGPRAAKVPRTKSGNLTVVGRHPVGKGQWIAVVEAEGQRFLVGITGAGFTPLGELRGDNPGDGGSAASLEALFSEDQGERPRSVLERARAATVRH